MYELTNCMDQKPFWSNDNYSNVQVNNFSAIYGIWSFSAVFTWALSLARIPIHSIPSTPIGDITYVVLSYQSNGLTSIKFSWEKTLELMVEFQCQQPKRFGKSNIIARTQGFAEQSLDSIPIWMKVKIYILFCKTKYSVTIINKIININLIKLCQSEV